VTGLVVEIPGVVPGMLPGKGVVGPVTVVAVTVVATGGSGAVDVVMVMATSKLPVAGLTIVAGTYRSQSCSCSPAMVVRGSLQLWLPIGANSGVGCLVSGNGPLINVPLPALINGLALFLSHSSSTR
jgi:hypothetical protein